MQDVQHVDMNGNVLPLAGGATPRFFGFQVAGHPFCTVERGLGDDPGQRNSGVAGLAKRQAQRHDEMLSVHKRVLFRIGIHRVVPMPRKSNTRVTRHGLL